MRAEIKTKTLQDALKKASKIARDSSPLEILKTAKLDFNKACGTMLVSASSLDLTLIAEYEAAVYHDGAFCIGLKKLIPFIGALQSEEVELEIDDSGWLALRAGPTKARFATFSAMDFPKTPDIDAGAGIKIPHESLSRIASMRAVACYDDARPNLKTICFQGLEGGRLKLGCTDGHRARQDFIKLKGSHAPDAWNEPLMADVMGIKELDSLMRSDEDILVELASDRSQIVFQQEGIWFYCRTILGKFPDFGPMLPGKYAVEATFDRKKLLSVVEACAHLAGKKNPGITLDIKKDEMTVYSASDGEREARTVLPAKSNNEFKFAMNHAYLATALREGDSKEVKMFGNDALGPCVFVDGESSHLPGDNQVIGSKWHVVMPVRLK